MKHENLIHLERERLTVSAWMRRLYQSQIYGVYVPSLGWAW